MDAHEKYKKVMLIFSQIASTVAEYGNDDFDFETEENLESVRETQEEIFTIHEAIEVVGEASNETVGNM